MKLWSVILATLIIFVMGFVAGAVLGKKKAEQAEPKPWSRSRSDDSNRSRYKHEQLKRVEFIAKFNKELGLSDEQGKQIEAILSESQMRTKAIWEEVAPRMKEEMETTQARIKELLNPEQEAKFDEVMKRPWGRGRNGGRPSSQPHDKPPPPPPGGTPPPNAPSSEGKQDAGACNQWPSVISICADEGHCR